MRNKWRNTSIETVVGSRDISKEVLPILPRRWVRPCQEWSCDQYVEQYIRSSFCPPVDSSNSILYSPFNQQILSSLFSSQYLSLQESYLTIKTHSYPQDQDKALEQELKIYSSHSFTNLLQLYYFAPSSVEVKDFYPSQKSVLLNSETV